MAKHTPLITHIVSCSISNFSFYDKKKKKHNYYFFYIAILLVYTATETRDKKRKDSEKGDIEIHRKNIKAHF